MFKRMSALLVAGVMFFAMASLAIAADDTQLWKTFVFKSKVTDKLTANAEMELRLGNDMKEHQYTHADVGISYKLHSLFSLGFNFRIVQELKSADSVNPFKEIDENTYPWIGDADVWTRKIVPHINGEFSYTLGGEKLKARSRFEIEMVQDQEVSNGSLQEVRETDVNLREKISYDLPFKFSIFKIFLADELFFKLTKEDNENLFYRNRFSVGVKANVHEHFSLSPYFLLQMTKKKTTDTSWSKAYVLGITSEVSI